MSQAEKAAASVAEILGRHVVGRAEDVLDALPVAVYTTDAAGRITYYNEAAAALWGCRPELGRSEFCGSWKLYWPDGTPLPHDECPMAQALKERRPIRGMEAVAERPDGTRIPFMPYPTPIFDAAGELIGAVNMLVDLSEIRSVEWAAQRLASIVEFSDDAIVSKNLVGVITSWNRGAERLFGYTAEEAVGKPITMLIPPDLHDQETEILSRVRRGERAQHYETVRRRKDGTLVDISLTVSPMKDRTGRIVGASKIARNITERRRAQEQQKLLVREMSHRVKNLFALASSVVGLSARSAQTPAALAASIQERLRALSRAHDLTLRGIGDGNGGSAKAATLHALILTIVSPYDDPGRQGEDRIVVNGCDVGIGSHAVTSFALLLHEFATNAAKYGALSSPTGRVNVDCSVENGDLRLRWAERDGPSADALAKEAEGFGSFLVRATVEGQFGGKISREWAPDGLTVHLAIPLDRLNG